MRDYKIPKNLDQQDTIGNFTFPQLAIMGVGFLIVLILFGTGMNVFLAILLALPVGFCTYVLMYVKRMEMPIYEYALVYLTYMASPKVMIYRKENRRDLLSIQEQIFIIEEEELKEAGGTVNLSEERKSRKMLLQEKREEKKRIKEEKQREKEWNKQQKQLNKQQKQSKRTVAEEVPVKDTPKKPPRKRSPLKTHQQGNRDQ